MFDPSIKNVDNREHQYTKVSIRQTLDIHFAIEENIAPHSIHMGATYGMGSTISPLLGDSSKRFNMNPPRSEGKVQRSPIELRFLIYLE